MLTNLLLVSLKGARGTVNIVGGTERSRSGALAAEGLLGSRALWEAESEAIVRNEPSPVVGGSAWDLEQWEAESVAGAES